MSIRLKALEKEDLRFIHKLDNNRSVMSYWFEEPYESFDELLDLYNKHIHDNNERRFIAWEQDAHSETETPIGLVELIEINTIHRLCEFQIIVAPHHQGKGYAQNIAQLGLEWAFNVLNLHKVYLYVSVNNLKAIHIYKKIGFEIEGQLKQEVWTNGQYEDLFRMAIFSPNK